MTPLRRSSSLVLLGVLFALVLTLGMKVTPAHAASSSTTDTTKAGEELSTWKAVVLGAVEGITEYLPISSTGHLVVIERWMNVGQDDATKDAIKHYTIIIQIGAILAVLVLYWRRIVEMLEGIIGRSDEGRRLLVALILAFIPAAVIGLTLESSIQDHLLEAGPVAAAWIFFGIAILLIAPRFRDSNKVGKKLEDLGWRDGFIIGCAQVLALWPGTSRSLVTIVAALFLGYSMAAAVEFSFLLGLATLGAATLYEGGKYGSEVKDAFGLGTPLLGILVAFVLAAVAIKWLVGYLTKHGLSIFGWYRIAIGVITLGALAFGWL